MEKCEKCGTELKVYYKWFCPKCEKPEPKVQTIYNLIRCLYYIEANGHPGFKKTAWDYIGETYNFSNDTVIGIYCPTEEDITDYGDDSKLISLIFEVFDIEGDTALFEISW